MLWEHWGSVQDSLAFTQPHDTPRACRPRERLCRFLEEIDFADGSLSGGALVGGDDWSTAQADVVLQCRRHVVGLALLRCAS